MINLVVARLGQDIRWIDELPASCGIRLHAPLHREASATEIHLRHLLELPGGAPRDLTVFCDGAPFEVAPALIDLLDHTEAWSDVQPLGWPQTLRDLPEEDLPLHPGQRDWIHGLPTQPQHFCPRSLSTLGGRDADAQWLARQYRRVHGLARGEHLLGHFLDLCGLEDLAMAARQSDLGYRAPGGILAVRQTVLEATVHRHRQALIHVLERVLPGQPVHARLWEHVGMHLFGLPFIMLEALPRPPSPPAPARLDAAMARAMASIDATLARATGSRPTTATPATFHLPAKAIAASAPAAPMDEAMLAFGRGDFEQAARQARQELMRTPDQARSRFMLAMSLAAQGRSDEALDQFENLLGREQEDVPPRPVRSPPQTTSPTSTSSSAGWPAEDRNSSRFSD
ncbi:MAG: hypothetical protein RL654_2196 [Pseudomonadota bacterium]|jgi:hypothetical protein